MADVPSKYKNDPEIIGGLNKIVLKLPQHLAQSLHEQSTVDGAQGATAVRLRLPVGESATVTEVQKPLPLVPPVKDAKASAKPLPAVANAPAASHPSTSKSIAPQGKPQTLPLQPASVIPPKVVPPGAPAAGSSARIPQPGCPACSSDALGQLSA